MNNVLIDETAPTQQIVGLFRVADTVELSPHGLWRRFGAVDSIARRDFMDYCSTHGTAVSLVVESVRRFSGPVALADLAPTSGSAEELSYISTEVLGQIERMQIDPKVERVALLPA